MKSNKFLKIILYIFIGLSGMYLFSLMSISFGFTSVIILKYLQPNWSNLDITINSFVFASFGGYLAQRIWFIIFNPIINTLKNKK